MCSCFLKDQSVGQARNKVPLHSHLQKHSTEELEMQQINVYGCRGYLVIVNSNQSSQLLSIVIIKEPFESIMIQFREIKPNTLRSICTISDNLCIMVPFIYSSVHLQNKQQTSSPKFFVRRHSANLKSLLGISDHAVKHD